jgi:hypothetical protein
VEKEVVNNISFPILKGNSSSFIYGGALKFNPTNQGS